MSQAEEILERISAIRKRLDGGEPLGELRVDAAAPLAPPTAVHLDEPLTLGPWHSARIDALAAGGPEQEPVLPPRLSASAARLLRQCRELLQALRELAGEVQADACPALASLHQSCVAQLHVILRGIQAFPPQPSAQLALCEGLQAVFESTEAQVGVLFAAVRERQTEINRIDYLAELIERLALGQDIGLEPLQSLAERVRAEARAGLPLRFLAASPAQPARFAAAHGLTTAQVLARVLAHEQDWQPKLGTALMATLVHDAGMTFVPKEILTATDPLTRDQRRLIERHAQLGAELAMRLWPGGWPVEGIAGHHERCNGTGYPHGQTELGIDSFAKMLAVCDVYAALGTPRPHRAAFDTRTALTDTLLLAEHGQLDRRYAEKLLVLSFFPVGSVVQLSDGATAVVLALPAPAASPNRPLVQILADAGEAPPAYPTLVDLSQQKERTVVRNLGVEERQRWVGRRYPHLV